MALSRRVECCKGHALEQIEIMLIGSLRKVVSSHGLDVADIMIQTFSRESEEWAVDESGVGSVRFVPDGAVVRRNKKSHRSMLNLAQLWSVLAVVHAGLVAGRKMTLRELWYRLKATKLFQSPAQVNHKVLEVCAAVSCGCGIPCPREALGVIAAPRGSMTGRVMLLQKDTDPYSLLSSTFEIPGDPEVIRAIGFDEQKTDAKCILVVEKDSCFRRLVDERFPSKHYPCILLTACGFPDLVCQ